MEIWLGSYEFLYTNSQPDNQPVSQQ